MPNYQNGKVYSIRSYQTENIYIGSTTVALSKRLQKHKSGLKTYEKNGKKFTSSYQLLHYDDCYIELIENVPCDNKEELLAREGHYIRSMDCVNKIKHPEGLTPEEMREHKKKYDNENKEAIAERRKKYRDENREAIAERRKKYRDENRDKILEHKKKYQNENKEAISERGKKYYNENKDKILEQAKKYYNENKDKKKKYYDEHKEAISERQKKPFACECGSTIIHKTKQQHFRTKKHKKYIADNIDDHDEVEINEN